MTNVWYVGRYGKRQLSIGDWAQLGVVTTKQNVWSLDNGWSLPESDFTPTQLSILASMDEFQTGQDGPRIKTPSPAITGGSSPFSIYFEKMKVIYDQFKVESASSLGKYTKPARGVPSSDIALERKPFGELSFYTKSDSDFAHIPTVDDVGNSISWTYGGDTPVVKNGAFTLQGKATGGPVNAAYLIADAGVGKKISRIGCDFAFDSTGKSTAGESICIAIMNQSSVNFGNTAFRIGVHFYITETGWRLQKISCATGSAVFTTIASGTFSETLLTDGTVSSNAAAGATTLSLSAYVPPGRYIVDSEFVHVLSCNGTTATLRLPTASAHNTGATMYIQTTTPELARWNLEAAINDLQSYGNGTSDVLVLIPHAGLQANWGNYPNLIKELRGACEAYGAAMVDIWTLGRSNYNYWNIQGFFGGGTNATAGTAGTDMIHPSDAGHKFMHDQILPLLVA